MPVAAAAIPLAGKLLPFLAKAGSAKALPWMIRGGMVAGGAAPGLMRGDLGQAFQGGALGGLGSLGVTGPLSGLATKGAGSVAGAIGRSGIGAQQGLSLSGNLARQQLGAGIAAGGLGLGAGLLSGRTAAGVGGAAKSVGGGALGAGASQLAREGNLVPMSALPQGYRPDVNSMVRGPEGNWWYQMDPSGVAQGNRMGRLLDAQVNASNINTLGNALFGQTERIGQAEFERQAAATQLASNIQQARQMALNSQEAGLRMGMDAGQNMAQAMQNRQNFRYF